MGDGTRVAQLQREHREHREHRERRPSARHAPNQPAATAQPVPALLSRRGQALLAAPYPGELYASLPDAGGRVFRAGQPDVSHFSQATWARLIARHARHSLQGVALYQRAHGYLPLREAIAAHIGITRGVHCSPDQIILTAGSQGALDLAARVLLDPGDRAWVEDPGYLGARGALLAAGAHLVPVPLDAEGIMVDTGRQLGTDARLAVVTPSHQFPTAVTMSLSRRLALLRWAHDARAWIVEDDYDSEYRFSGRPLEALQGLDRAERVIYVGTFSKVLFPALRLGYLVAPAALVPGFLAARRFTDVHLPPLEQMALADFLVEGHFARHLRRMRLVYLQRRDALVEALRRELEDVVTVDVPEAGMHLVVWLSAGLSATAISRQGGLRGLNMLPILQNGRREGLMLGFAADTPAALRAGVRALAEIVRAM